MSQGPSKNEKGINFLLKIIIKIDENFKDICLDSDPIFLRGSGSGFQNFSESGSGSDLRGWIRIRSISDRIRNPA